MIKYWFEQNVTYDNSLMVVTIELECRVSIMEWEGYNRKRDCRLQIRRLFIGNDKREEL